MVGVLRGFIVWAYLGSKHQPNYQRLGKRMLLESDDVDDVVCFILFRNGFFLNDIQKLYPLERKDQATAHVQRVSWRGY